MKVKTKVENATLKIEVAVLNRVSRPSIGTECEHEPGRGDTQSHTAESTPCQTQPVITLFQVTLSATYLFMFPVCFSTNNISYCFDCRTARCHNGDGLHTPFGRARTRSTHSVGSSVPVCLHRISVPFLDEIIFQNSNNRNRKGIIMARKRLDEHLVSMVKMSFF